MQQDFLSDIELYYSEKINNDLVILDSAEAKHVSKVMRHEISDIIYITNGLGSLFKTEIISIEKNKVTSKIIKETRYTNHLENITFCISRVKKSDRFEFALEKSIELGITNFIIFDSERSIAKGDKSSRWNLIALSAMKQSLRTYKPRVSYSKRIQKILENEGEHFIFDQHGDELLTEFLNGYDKNKRYYFYFGPEGGFTENELTLFERRLKLTENRLRSETAVITAASIISMFK